MRKRNRQSTASSRVELVTCPECDYYDNHPDGGVRADNIYGKGKHLEKQHPAAYKKYVEQNAADREAADKRARLPAQQPQLPFSAASWVASV